MSTSTDPGLLEALLNSWDRNNLILLNLLRALPEDALDVRAVEGSQSVAEMFLHIQGTRMFFLSEDAPEFAGDLKETEWRQVRDPNRIARMLGDSAQRVHDAVKSHVVTGTAMLVRYDHPILFLQHMIWHEGYHHGQIKLALKAAGRPLDDEEIGPATWDVWMDKTTN